MTVTDMAVTDRTVTITAVTGVGHGVLHSGDDGWSVVQ